MITHYASKKILNQMFALKGDSFGSQCYLGLSSTPPRQEKEGEGNYWNITEPASNDTTGYERILLGKLSGSTSSLSKDTWLIDFSGEDRDGTYITSVKEIHFNIAKTNWGQISHVCIFDNSNNLLAFGEILNESGVATPIDVDVNSVVVIPKNGFKIGIDNSLSES